MDIKQFLKPTWKKIAITIILQGIFWYLVIFQNAFAEIKLISYEGPINPLTSSLATLLNPFMLYIINQTIRMPLALVIVGGIFWNYLLSCLLSKLVWKE